MVEALIPGLSALGVGLLLSGIYRLRRRASTSRRVTAVLLEKPLPEHATDEQTRLPIAARLVFHLRQVLAVIEARDSILRGPAIALACVSSLIGVATASAGWLALALLCGAAAYALGGSQRRRSRVEVQALDAMQLLSSGLRAGYSVPQAIALVARRSPEPTASEFAVAAQEFSVGLALSDTISRLARRTGNTDYELVAIIIRVQHEVGGNLAQILDSVSNTLRERFELRRQVHALTAQQRLSSVVLSVLPFGLLTILFVMDRSFVDPLFTQTVGRILLGLAGVMVFVGWTLMRSLGRVEV